MLEARRVLGWRLWAWRGHEAHREEAGRQGGMRGASWGADGTIVYSPTFNSGLMSISADGGEPRTLTTPDAANHERTQWGNDAPRVTVTEVRALRN